MGVTKLSVNVNKLATLRNAREKNIPDVIAMSRDILQFGAHGLTVHPRPDGRHIRKTDVFDLSQLVQSWNCDQPPAEFNIEGYPSEDFLSIVESVKPHQCTLVPDPPDALTSNAGWDLAVNKAFLKTVLARLKSASIRTSLFVDPMSWSVQQSEALAELKPARVELYTEAYAESFATDQQSIIVHRYRQLSEIAVQFQIGINAGHDLNLKNLPTLIAAIPEIAEVSIGHALICDALYLGLETTIQAYLRALS